MRSSRIITAIATVIAFAPLQGQTDVASWREDVRTIAQQLPATHPNAFYRMKRESWDSAIQSLDSRLPSMTRNQAAVGLMQLVAMVNDGHTGINPLTDVAMGFHYYPVQFELFSDGLFIRSAAPERASIVGARVVRIGDVSAEEALTRVATTVGHENEWWVRAWAPLRLSLSELIDGLGITKDPAHLMLQIEKNGKRETVTLEPTGIIKPSGHNPLSGIDMSGWIDMRTSSVTPLWQRNPQRPYWYEFVREDSTLFVSYRAVVTFDEMPNITFWRNVFAAVDSLPVKRLVIDLRENIGGNSFYNKQVVRGIVARPRIDRTGSLFVVTGGRTFSAAMNLALDLEQWTNATFVGEPTGNSTVFFGDHEQIVLPKSRFTVNVSTLPWYPDNPRDKRQFMAPRMYTPLSSTQYSTGVDPVMRAIQQAGAKPALAETVADAITRGDSTSALKLITDAANDPLNRFRSPEADINALGYRLMPSDKSKALTVFRLNTVAFPKSPNTWDSYGEALLEMGQRDAAIAAYKKATTLDPGYASSVEALRRLGAN